MKYVAFFLSTALLVSSATFAATADTDTKSASAPILKAALVLTCPNGYDAVIADGRLLCTKSVKWPPNTKNSDSTIVPTLEPGLVLSCPDGSQAAIVNGKTVCIVPYSIKWPPNSQ
jgi:hypothetical protein